MLLSIIIPAYNVQNYIRKTLLSIFDQYCDLSDIEIIVVNDGSPDDSRLIVKSMIDSGYDIQLIDQSNQGLSMARNNGLSVAKGEYVWFIDSDDWIADKSLSEILSYLDGTIDELNFKSKRILLDEKTIIGEFSYTNNSSCLTSGEEVWLYGIPHNSIVQLSVYRKQFLVDNNLTFISGIYHEDFDFCLRASYLSKKTRIINKAFYYQRENPNSITHVNNPKKSFDYIIVAKSLYTFMHTKNITGIIKNKFCYYIAMAINNALDSIDTCNVEAKDNFNHELKQSKFLLYCYLKSKNVSYILFGIILMLCFGKYTRVYKLLK